jgi:restriction system protein
LLPPKTSWTPIVFNGIVSATNRATGQAEELHLISAPASRAEFSKLVLDQLDPQACLKNLKAIVSRHPYDLEAVEPVIDFQKAKYRFADPVDALAGIDSRPDLLKMDWYRFENLIRQLFEAMGLEGPRKARSPSSEPASMRQIRTLAEVDRCG